jgi:hypothetical protein
MNVLRKSILIGFTVLGMAAAQAQEAPKAGDHKDGAGPHGKPVAARMAEMYAKRQARLHDQLKLTAQQESAWASYQAAIKPAAPAGGERPEHKDFSKVPAPERLAKALDMTKQRETHMQAHLTALTAFYGQLSTEQKATFDKHAFGGEHFGHRGGPHDRRDHRGWHGDEHGGWDHRG